MAEAFSPTEISAVTGASVKAVYKAISERLPRGASVHRDQQHYLTRWGAVCFVLDRALPKDVPLSVRRQLYASILDHKAPTRVQCERGILSYVVDVESVAERLDRDLARYNGAMRLIVQDNAIQGGAATFRDTRILVHHIADLMEQGADEAELRSDYPRLTSEMIAAARLYVRAHPRRGRPRKPGWRGDGKAGKPDPQQN